MSRPSKSFNNNACVKDVHELAAWIAKGASPHELLGVEFEAFLYDKATGEPADYPTISKFLTELKKFGWRGEYENEKLVGLNRNGCTWSIEPGGQIEYGDAPRKSVREIDENIDICFKEACAAAAVVGCDIAGMGYHPTLPAADLPLMPKSRSHQTRHYMQDECGYENVDEIMRATAAVQVNVGFTSEDDMVRKVRLGLALQPVIIALFANSPFKEGELSGNQSERAKVLHNAFGGRLGNMLPMAFDADFGFEKYAAYACHDVPVMGIYQGRNFIATDHDERFDEFIKGELDIVPGQKATLQDWANHLNTIWPDVRIRRHLEMRAADCGGPDMIKALPALWAGILYDPSAQEEACALISDWSEQEREYLRAATPVHGLQTRFREGTVGDIAKRLLEIAQKGLVARGMDEAHYLDPLHKIADTGINRAQEMSAKFRTEWEKNASKALASTAFSSHYSTDIAGSECVVTLASVTTRKAIAKRAHA